MAAKATLVQEASTLSGEILLPVSKSMWNRSLIMHALKGDKIPVPGIDAGDDTHFLYQMLTSDKDLVYAGDGGTALRFMLAYACFKNQPVTITGSDALIQRPVKPLVDALISLGADIEYTDKVGFPPLRINAGFAFPTQDKVLINAGISSQFITALLLIAPYLPNGLSIEWNVRPVSWSYISLTLSMMQRAGVAVHLLRNGISISPGRYAEIPDPELDWSSASYFYGFLSAQASGSLFFPGLSAESVQPDVKTRVIFEALGIATHLHSYGVEISREGIQNPLPKWISFHDCPDIAQSFMASLAVNGKAVHLSGLSTLRVKETDRISAMQHELQKVNVHLDAQDESEGELNVYQYGNFELNTPIVFSTYKDHRMAMALSILSTKGKIALEDPDVVRKSFPGFFTECRKIGIDVELG